MESWMRYCISILIICCGIQCMRISAKHHRREVKHKILCVNGTEFNGRCICYQGFIGTHCERQMFCASYERTSNGSCINCQDGFTGDRCDEIVCEHGKVHEVEQQCICDKPYSGRHCTNVTMEDVYLHYNQKMNLIGPLGVLSVIPMMLAFHICEKKAHMRQVKRIERTWAEQQQMVVHTAAVKALLAEKEPSIS